MLVHPDAISQSTNGKRGPWSEHERNALARLAAMGTMPITRIAQALGRPLATVRDMLANDEDIVRRVEHAHAFQSRILAEAHFSLLDMHESAASAIRAGLSSSNEQLRVSTARWIFERNLPKEAVRVEHTGEVDLNANHEIRGAFLKIAEQLPGAGFDKTDFTKSVLTAERALAPPNEKPHEGNGVGEPTSSQE